MRFLLRLAFWFGVVLVLLPTIGSQPVPKAQVGTVEAMSAAKAAMSDLQKFCERQSDACIIGSQTAVTLGHRAQVGAKMLYEFLNDHLGSQETGSVGTTTTRASRQTLTSDDLAPVWRGRQLR